MRERSVVCEGPYAEGCGRKAKYLVHLMTRSIPRCEEHKDAFISTVLSMDLIGPVIPKRDLR